MSFRLGYELGDLQQSATLLGLIAEQAAEIEHDHRRLASTVGDCGSQDLARATRDFLDAWSYGMKVVGEDATGLGEAIGECAATYQALDQAGCAALLEAS